MKYSLEDARRIVMKCAKIYQNNLVDKVFLIIYKDRIDNKIKYLEIIFGKENYQHLTGIELIDHNGNIREHVAGLFYKKCLNNTLAKNELSFRDNNTSCMKLTSLPILMKFQKVTKISGDYNNSGNYLFVDKVVGNVNFCLGIKKVGNYYVPASALLEDIRKLTKNRSQVLAIMSKNKEDDIYVNIRHVAKGINLNHIYLPKEINDMISLSNYIPKN